MINKDYIVAIPRILSIQFVQLMLKNTGFTLIEVVISLLLFSLVLLGFNAMQWQAVRETQSAYHFTVAASQLHAMTERLRALDKWSGLEQQIQKWNLQNQQVLPQGKGEVSGHYPAYTIKITWGKSECLTQSLE